MDTFQKKRAEFIKKALAGEVEPDSWNVSNRDMSLRARKTVTPTVDEVAPPGFEGTVKALKKHQEIENPWRLAWYMKNKGFKSHK